MHPSFAVVFFTACSGAGYGLWLWLGSWVASGQPVRPVAGLAALALGFVLVTAGLLSSTLHLGKPLRSWRAFSQWRSSWLSREGIAALATYHDKSQPTSVAVDLSALAGRVAQIRKEVLAARDRSQVPLPLRGRRWEWRPRADGTRCHALCQTDPGSDATPRQIAGQRADALHRVLRSAPSE